MICRLAPCVVLAIVLTFANRSDAADPRLELFDGIDGATCKYFNAGGGLPWRRPLGDWRDAAGESHGNRPFVTAIIPQGDEGRAVVWDVTPLVRDWVSGSAPASGMVLAAIPPSAVIDFASREMAADSMRPRLLVTLDGAAQPISIPPTADVWLDCSTVRSLGTRDRLRVGDTQHAALQFDVSRFKGRSVHQAVLQMTTAGKQRSGSAVGIYQLDPPRVADSPGPHRGLAASYPRDQGIAGSPDVWMATDFESATWQSAWTYVSPNSHVDRVRRDEGLRFEPLSGYALRVEVAQGDNLGLDMGFDFRKQLGYEPEEVYFRYYLRFGDDWVPTVDGGKLPGISGTYGKSGWGGRRADGTTGWSMRGGFNRAPSPSNPLFGHTTVSTYAYHTAMEDKYGDHWSWVKDGVGVLERNRWYCLEQRFKVNAVGASDGIMQAWVDGVLALDQTQVSVRVVPHIRIQRVWMNVFHGGTAPADRSMHLYIDNVVVARKPIGCRAD